MKIDKQELYHYIDTVCIQDSHRQSLKWTQYPDCIGAWVAESDFGTSKAVADTLHSAVDNNLLAYLPAGTLEKVKQSCANFQRDNFGWNVKADDIFVMPDVLTVLRIMLDHFIPDNSKVVVLTPAYMPFTTIPAQHGHSIVQVKAVRAENNAFTLDFDSLEQAFIAGAKLLILCNPWNPIGRVLSADELQKISQLASKYNVLVFSDEIHSPVVVDKNYKHINYANLNEACATHTITATAASKGWNIPGLKCAQVIVTDSKLKEKFAKFAPNYQHWIATVGALATISAYSDDSGWIDGVCDYIYENSKYLQQALAETDIKYYPPEGCYLTWIEFTDIDLGQYQNLQELLQYEYKLAVVDGTSCGQGYENCIRFNIAMPRKTLEECVQIFLSLNQKHKAR